MVVNLWECTQQRNPFQCYPIFPIELSWCDLPVAFRMNTPQWIPCLAKVYTRGGILANFLSNTNIWYFYFSRYPINTIFSIKSVINRNGTTCRNNNNLECPNILNAPWDELPLMFFKTNKLTNKQTDTTKRIISPASRSIITETLLLNSSLNWPSSKQDSLLHLPLKPPLSRDATIPTVATAGAQQSTSY